MGRLEQRITDDYRHRESVVDAFFREEAERIARCCHAVAQRFHRGGRILAFGTGAAATDAQHIAVEFVHPVIVGKRALPAIALPNDAPPLLGAAVEDPHAVFSGHVSALCRPQDIAIGISLERDDAGAAAVAAALKAARAAGALTLALEGPGHALASAEPDVAFACDADDPFVVQEVHETLYHVLWELVHVFFEHRGLLGPSTRGDRETVGASSFLYPMLDSAEGDLEAVLGDVSASVRRKAQDVCDARRPQGERPETLLAAATSVAERMDAGGKLLAFGNGGSATDAQDLVGDLVRPPPGLRPLPAIALTNDAAVITAVANDVGYDNVFLRQVIAYGDPGDVAVGISTSGGSRNVVAALEEARRRGLWTVALCGYGGGAIGAADAADVTLTVDAEYVPRIQEAQATQYHVLRRLLDEILPP